MQKELQQKIAEFKRLSAIALKEKKKAIETSNVRQDNTEDSLSKAIRNEKEAATFMAELRAVLNRS